MAYIGKQPTIGNFQVCDAISVVNNQAAYTMQVDTVNVSPESANHMIVSLNGVIQKPTDAFTVSGSTITFDSNLVTGDVIDFIQILGNVLDLGVPSDATVSTAKIVDGAVTSAKLASGVGGVDGIVSNANATAITIDSSEQVGIGTSAPNTKLMVELGTSGSGVTDTLRLKHAGTSANDGCRIQFTAGTSTSGAGIGAVGTALNKSDLTIYAGGNTERGRFTGDGNFIMLRTTPPSASNSGWGVIKDGAANMQAKSSASSTASYKHYIFFNANGQVGSIATGGTSTAYTTSSDYRLKENVVEITNATDRLKQLQPKRFNFIADADTTVDGFIAHEVSSVVPEAITGEKDAVNEDGTPDYQGIDQSKLVPLLVKTIQELEARITTLENA